MGIPMEFEPTACNITEPRTKKDADYVFYELTRSICPNCRKVIDAKILLRDNKVFMAKRCPDCGPFEALVYGDAEAYTNFSKFNKPGTIPLAYGSEIKDGCPYDCGLCPDHQQPTCLGIIEVNSACNMNCPLCFSEAGPGFSVTLEEVEAMLDDFVRTEGNPEVVQFSGGEPTIHPQIIDFVKAAKDRGIRFVMINTNGKRIAHDDRFLEQLNDVRPSLYFQFDGFDAETYRVIRGEPGILEEKLRALDRLATIGLSVTLVPAIERGVNEHEVGKIIDFAIQHPAVRGINFQPAFHAGRHMQHDPLQRMTIPDVLKLIEQQTAGKFLVSDFIPVPCCFPTCNSVTYAFIDGEKVTPLTRIVNVHDYLDYITNRVLPDFSMEVKTALEGLWSSSSVPGSQKSARAVRRLLPGLRPSREPHGWGYRKERSDDHAAGLHGPVDIQSKEPDEVLQRVSSAGRETDSFLCLQHHRLSRTGPIPNGSDGTKAKRGTPTRNQIRAPTDSV